MMELCLSGDTGSPIGANDACKRDPCGPKNGDFNWVDVIGDPYKPFGAIDTSFSRASGVHWRGAGSMGEESLGGEGGGLGECLGERGVLSDP